MTATSARRALRLGLTALAASTAVLAVVAVVAPVWLLLRLPAAVTPPDPGKL